MQGLPIRPGAGRDRIDDHVRALRGGDRLRERAPRAEVAPVRQQDEDPGAVRHLLRARRRTSRRRRRARFRSAGPGASDSSTPATSDFAPRAASAQGPRARTRPARSPLSCVRPSRNCSAARFASRRGRPDIDWELSTASTIACAEPEIARFTNAGRLSVLEERGAAAVGTTPVTPHERELAEVDAGGSGRGAARCGGHRQGKRERDEKC